ncbi:long-chain fatty acid--CoA ligase [Crossiella sp. S99.2]|nr:long-chain fatty acid--CoA ligase [Crossiella sp. S99.2]MCK2258070.1 long-chain fatty acid--CoA ligase [Crossiella sp. S99.1]
MTPQAVAVRHEDRELSYAELSRRVTGLAHGLSAAGVRFGDRVAYLGPNHPAYLELLFACGLLGAVFVPLNFRLAAPEIDHALTDSGAAMLVHTPAHAGTVAALAEHPGLRLIPVAEEYERLLSTAAEPPDIPVSLDDTCLIMYTSGSTGRPKGAQLTHGNLTWNSVNVLVETDLAGDERALIAAPLFHTAALGMICLPTLLKGGTVVLHSAFDPGAALDTIERERITLMFGVPTMFAAMAAHPCWPAADLASLRTLLCGGAPVPTAIIQRYLDRGIGFAQGYGMTETSPGALLLDPARAQDKIGSAGVPSFFTDVRVVDPGGHPVPPGIRGEVIVSGPNVMRGYWRQPGETAAAVRAGWFHSGDIATVDEDGYVYLVDRLKDMIISGGENIYPAEVEEAIHAFPGVQACAVIGVPDEKWGEVGKAIVLPEPGAQVRELELLAFLRTRLAAYKVPKSVRLVSTLPTSGSGKILKPEVRKLYS